MIVHTCQVRRGPNWNPDWWAKDMGLCLVVLGGSSSAILGAVSEDVKDDEIVRAFAYALDHSRYGMSFMNVTDFKLKQDNTRQIHVAWDHPEMLKAREEYGSLHDMAMAALADAEEQARIAYLQNVARDMRAESFALALDYNKHAYPAIYAQQLRENVDEMLSRYPDSANLRALHILFHETYQKLIEDSNGTAFGTTHSKLKRGL